MDNNNSSGLTRKELAAKLGISVRELYRIIKESGIKIAKGRRIPPSSQIEIIEAYHRRCRYGSAKPINPENDPNPED